MVHCMPAGFHLSLGRYLDALSHDFWVDVPPRLDCPSCSAIIVRRVFVSVVMNEDIIAMRQTIAQSMHRDVPAFSPSLHCTPPLLLDVSLLLNL